MQKYWHFRHIVIHAVDPPVSPKQYVWNRNLTKALMFHNVMQAVNYCSKLSISGSQTLPQTIIHN